MAKLDLHLLGSPRVLADGAREVPGILGSAKIMALLAYLATSRPGAPRRRELITALLWPERDRQHARHALRQLLTRVRHLAGDGVLACDTEETICLSPAGCWADTAALEEALARGRLAGVVEYYTGPFLEGFHLSESPEFERWTDEQRQRYERAALDAADRLADEARAEADPKAEARWLARAIEIDAFSEPHSERLVALLLEVGERGRALAERERLRRRVEGDLGLSLDVEPIPPEPGAGLFPGDPGAGRSRGGARGRGKAPGPLTAGEEVRRGLFHFRRWRVESVERALAHFSRAAALDPDSAPAHAGVALAYCTLGHFGHLPPDVAFPRAEASARHALELEPDLPDAHMALGMKAHVYDRRVGEALDRLHHARDIAPHLPFPHWALGLVHASLQQHDEARASIRHARLLDPVSIPIGTGEAWVHIGAGDIDRAERHVWDTLELDPDAPQALWQLGMVRELQGNPAEAVGHLRRALDASPVNPLILGSLGHVLARAGDDDGSLRILQRLRNAADRGHYIPHFALAMIHAGRDEPDLARVALQNALDQRDGLVAFLLPWPFTRSLHTHPWFADLVDSLFHDIPA